MPRLTRVVRRRNPKVALFYVAFLPQFVDPTRGHVPLQLLILGLLFNITSLAVDTSVALLASLLGTWLKRRSRAAKLIPWLAGSVLVGLGVRLALSGRQSTTKKARVEMKCCFFQRRRLR